MSKSRATCFSSPAGTAKSRRKLATSTEVTMPSALAILAERAIIAAEKATCRRVSGSAMPPIAPPAQRKSAATAPAPCSAISPSLCQMPMAAETRRSSAGARDASSSPRLSGAQDLQIVEGVAGAAALRRGGEDADLLAVVRRDAVERAEFGLVDVKGRFVALGHDAEFVDAAVAGVGPLDVLPFDLLEPLAALAPPHRRLAVRRKLE